MTTIIGVTKSFLWILYLTLTLSTTASYVTPLSSKYVCFCPPDNCKKMGLVFDDVVGIVEIINCKDVKVQVCAV